MRDAFVFLVFQSTAGKFAQRDRRHN